MVEKVKTLETAKTISEQAKDEIRKELVEQAKSKLKSKYRQLADAQKMVKNVEAEIKDLEDEIRQDLESSS